MCECFFLRVRGLDPDGRRLGESFAYNVCMRELLQFRRSRHGFAFIVPAGGRKARMRAHKSRARPRIAQQLEDTPKKKDCIFLNLRRI